MKSVYFDSAATTQLRPEVISVMTSALNEEYGNPSSTHSYGRSSKAILENCRKEIAELLNVTAAEIIFTSGGTEADNLALISSVQNLGVKRIITSPIEHHAVLHTAEILRDQYDITLDFVGVKGCGTPDYEDLQRLLSESDEKTLVSLMHVNNEVGTMLDLDMVAGICKQHNALFHSDMVQSVGHFEVDLSKTMVDFAAVSAHKFHGPKGVGFAFVRKDSGLKPLIFGGSQERGLRAGTEPVYAILGMSEALKISYQNLEQEREYIKGLKSYFISRLKAEVPGALLNGACGDLENSTYTLVNVCLPVSEQKAALLLFQLDLKGIACSKGSACQSGSDAGSHVLREILSENDLKKPSVRFSMSSFNTKDEIDYVISVLKEFTSED